MSTFDDYVEKMKKIIMDNRRITIKGVANDFNITIGSWHAIFFNVLGIILMVAKFVPKLSSKQKQR